MNPVLEEMDKAETKLNNLFRWLHRYRQEKYVSCPYTTWGAAERRLDKEFDSPQDFFNWITLGMPDKFESMIEGAEFLCDVVSSTTIY